ncbi:MAG: carboxypeptidase regulatory-like domain-containing protein [Candidatus Eiseniibacteriota bacterium]
MSVSRIVALAMLLAPVPALAQVTLQGRVTDAGGAPISGADIDLFEAQTGTKLDLGGQNDNTDGNGSYALTVSPDVYHVEVEPPAGRSELAAMIERDFVLASSATLDVVLPLGSRLTGRVTGPDGAPVAAVDLDFVDPSSGRQAATGPDDTGADGRFAVTVLRGTWHVAFGPVPASGVGPVRVDAVDLSGNATLDVQLPRGFRVIGRVQTDTGTDVFRADLDARDRDARRPVPLSTDETDFAGAFALDLPEGVLDLFVLPPVGAALAPAARYSVAVSSDLDLGTLVLRAGVSLSGTTLDPDGMALAGADLDLLQAGSCDPYPVPGGTTAGDGAYAVRVEPGVYDVLVRPVAGSGLAPYRIDGVAVTADAVVELRAPSWTPATLDVGGLVTDVAGSGISGAVLTGAPLDPTGAAWTTTSDATGAFVVAAIPGSYRVLVSSPAGSPSMLRTFEMVELPCGLPSVIALGVTLDVAAAGPLFGRPNPWRDTTDIALALAQAEPDALLEIFDVAGRRVRTLVSGPLPGGESLVPWDGTTDGGSPVVSGIYFVRLRASETTSSTKITRIAP